MLLSTGQTVIVYIFIQWLSNSFYTLCDTHVCIYIHRDAVFSWPTTYSCGHIHMYMYILISRVFWIFCVSQAVWAAHVPTWTESLFWRKFHWMTLRTRLSYTCMYLYVYFILLCVCVRMYVCICMLVSLNDFTHSALLQTYVFICMFILCVCARMYVCICM
jgi:hypothetical protein